jgi:hypothetical protein
MNILNKKGLGGIHGPDYTIYIPGCGTPPPPTCQDCVVKELGRVRGIWLQKSSFTFTNISDPNQWQNAICNQNVYVFPYINGSATQAEQLSDGYGNVPQTLDSYEYTLDVHEPKYTNNIAFWNYIKRSNSFLVGYKTQFSLHLSQVSAMFFPKAPVSADIKSKIDLNIIIKFVQSDLIQPVIDNSGVFNNCVDC